jgi:uncharacterized protein YyaL (SSP411 family)
VEQVAAELGRNTGEVAGALGRARETLRATRSRRPRPHLDDKILVGWNGLMISAAARAAAALDRPQDLELAARAARCVLDRCALRTEGSFRLLRRYRDGEAAVAGQLEDYAALALGLLDLYLASFDEAWLQRSLLLVEALVESFLDPADGAFFDSPGLDPHVLVRTKEPYDGAEPSGNALAADVLARLGCLLHRPDLTAQAECVIARFRPVLEQAPHVMAHTLQVVEALLEPPSHVVIVGDPASDQVAALLRAAREAPFDPFRQVIVAPNEGATILRQLAIRRLVTKDTPAEAIAFACRSFTCELPTTSARELSARLAAWARPADESAQG